MNAQDLGNMIENNAAVRRRQRLQPVGGSGDKIFPPTYPGDARTAPPRHVLERRVVGGDDVWCVLIDSVQSQANRLEECLLSLIDEGLRIPYVVVDFRQAGLVGITQVTSLDAPHRVYDAIFRDSLLAGQPFMQSPVGLRLAQARPDDASALLEHSPTALLLGAWHSTGQGGGLGAKFARCLVSEIVGVGVPVDMTGRPGAETAVTASRRTGSRIDPLGILKGATAFKGANGWDVTEAGAGEGAKKVRPSETNHGNIRPSVDALGVTCAYAEHTFVLSFAALRHLRFDTEPRNSAARTLIAALALVALAEQDARGYSLRSRCDLVCEGRAPLELVHPDGSAEPMAVDRVSARALLDQSLERCRGAGFALHDGPLTLVPQDKLVAIVRESQQLALAGSGEAEQPDELA